MTSLLTPLLSESARSENEQSSRYVADAFDENDFASLKPETENPEPQLPLDSSVSFAFVNYQS